MNCMSENCYQTFMLPNLRHSNNLSVRSAIEGNLCPLGLVIYIFCLVRQTLTNNFIACKIWQDHLYLF